MAKLGMCSIYSFKLSPKSKRAVSDIKSILDSGQLLQGVLAATPFYNIFASPSVTKSPFEKLITIREHDWDTFVKAMSGAHLHTRNQVFMIANEREVFTYGDEQKFWSCVSNASK
ncbi:hypothetical protein [Vibrio europaeus]|uniref:Uncharacterized protein n=1 Tax=Vibrio europaeus TaxID=300876 RepID=A0A178J3L4_9VIBR|nr:hypothetical protein [Vibrio europaeus]MDC5708433.1 hypothetical protein [Vibrio europaeus]MDC5713095.1 hypothetical protein [Vibrio europaeus]MDC5728134.1 hypothetical protein [Vibrio europaeus]MDC5733272.1 hypothetical protein [Vibrio europaeus]MDC5742351.1 hypothetical protein [Vibrio europaeus]